MFHAPFTLLPVFIDEINNTDYEPEIVLSLICSCFNNKTQNFILLVFSFHVSVKWGTILYIPQD